MFIPHASASTAGLLGIIPRPSILSRLFLAGYGPTAVQLCVDTLLDSNTLKPLHQLVDSCGTGPTTGVLRSALARLLSSVRLGPGGPEGPLG